MKIARVFFDCDLRCGFDGLIQKMTDAEMDTEAISKHTMVIFMNRKTTAFKLLAGKDYLVYYRNGNRRVPLDAIQHLPSCFNGTDLQFGKAIEKTVKARLRIA